MNGVEFTPGDCFYYSQWPSGTDSYRRFPPGASPVSADFLWRMPDNSLASSSAEMIGKFACKVHCDACPHVFECMHRGQLQDAT